MPSLNRPPRSRLTLRILAYGLAGGFGLICVVLGGSWFVARRGALMAGFPASLAEAVACTAGGAMVFAWSVARIRREIARPEAELRGRDQDCIAGAHPEARRQLTELAERSDPEH